MDANSRRSSPALPTPAEQTRPSSRRMAWVKAAGSVVILLVIVVAALVAWL